MNTRITTAILLAACAVAGGCSRSANPQAVDTIRLTPEQERDLFVSSDNLGPETSVILLANVPKARYTNGVIAITNGRELRVVAPHAWRTYTGTALAAEDAERLLARAERLDQGLRDLGAAAGDLRSYLDSRAIDARAEAGRLESESDARRKIDASVHRQYATELAQIAADESRDVGAVNSERETEIARIAEAHGKRIVELAETWEGKRTALSDQHRRELAAMDSRIKTDRLIAENGKRSKEDLMAIDELGRRHRDELVTKQTTETKELESKRSEAMAAQREATEIRLADVRRIYASREDRIRQEASSRRQVVLQQQQMAPKPEAPAPEAPKAREPAEPQVDPTTPETKATP